MALSQSPPPLFQQGLSVRFRFLIAVVAAIVLIQVDFSLNLLKPLRQGLMMVLYPIEQVLLVPRDVFGWVANRTSAIANLTDREQALELSKTKAAESLIKVEQLQQENDSLRTLLDLKKTLKHKTVAAEISHDARDAFSNRVVIDRGSQHGIAPGHPVINAQGVVGQVIRVSPITAEVSLVTDPSLSIPVNLPRSGIRSLAHGAGDGQQIDLRYLNINAEVEVGDVLVTSGLDGLYPPGLPVARVTQIERAGKGQFPKVHCTPTAKVGANRHVLVLLVDKELLPPAPREFEKSIPKKSAGGTVK